VISLVRHGETGWTRSAQHTGVTDLPLTEAGETEARALRARLSDLIFVLVLTRRQRQLQTRQAQAGREHHGESTGVCAHQSSGAGPDAKRGAGPSTLFTTSQDLTARVGGPRRG